MSGIDQVYFFSYRYAIRYHIARCLLERGWKKAASASDALFSDDNVTLNDALSKHLEYKHLLAELVANIPHSIMPETYSINDINYQEIIAKIIYRYYLLDGKYQPIVPHVKWILKPSMLNNGDNINLFDSIEKIKTHYMNKNRLGGEHVLQRYISEPDLIDGRKYTFRIPVILTNYDGVFLYHKGYINLSSMRYDPAEPMQQKKMHVTNYVLDGDFANITQRCTDELADFSSTFSDMKNIVMDVTRAIVRLFPEYLKASDVKRFEIFGFDFTLDSQKKLWLLEVNQGPDAPMYEDNLLKKVLWEPFWNDIIDDFVLPIAKGTTAHYSHFVQALSAEQTYSRYKCLLKKLTNLF